MILIHAQKHIPAVKVKRQRRQAMRADEGQATAEYALVMLAAASLAGLLLAWVTSTDAVGRLMDTVLDSMLSGIS